MKKYPAIYSTPLKSTYLYLDEGNYCSLGFPAAGVWHKASDSDDLTEDVNITREYLSNTWGVVESKEHAEFIIELARGAGLITSDTWNNTYDYFSLDHNGLLFWSDKAPAESRGLKQTTIPLPPKAKEWPQVGDEVCWDENIYKGVIKAISDGNAWCMRDNGYFYTIKLDRIKKPKSKEDILTEELQTKLCNNNYVDNFTLASDIINGMIPGLSYNSDIESTVKGVINKHLDGDY